MKIGVNGPLKGVVRPVQACDAERCMALRKLSSEGGSSRPTPGLPTSPPQVIRSQARSLITSTSHDACDGDL
jgi:hypothetical protein